MVYTLVSGVLIWTAYEILLLRSYASHVDRFYLRTFQLGLAPCSFGAFDTRDGLLLCAPSTALATIV